MAWTMPKTDWTPADGVADADLNAIGENLQYLHDHLFELVAIIEDQKAQGTSGGTFTSGADRTRDLNTIVYGNGGPVSLANNQFTITPDGTQEFLICWSAPAFSRAYHQSLLYRVSPSAATVKRGTSEYAYTSVQTRSLGNDVVSISAATTYEIRHRCTESCGFGRELNLGTEVYTQVLVYRKRKVA